MPAEQNHKMDTLLKAYARKRREEAGPPIQMSPATRRMLQAEVDRSLRNPAPPAPRERVQFASLVRFWPRFALGAAGIALLLGAASLWLRFEENDEAQLAQAIEREKNLFLFAQGASDHRLPGEALGGSTALKGVPESFGVVTGDSVQDSTPNSGAVRQRELRDERVEVAVANAPSGSRFEPMFSNAATYAFRVPGSPATRSAADQAAEVARPQSRGRDAAHAGLGVAPQLQLQVESLQTGLEFGRSESVRLVEAAPRPAAPSQTMTARANSPATAAPLAKSGISPQRVAGTTLDVKAQASNLMFQQVDPLVRYRRNLNSPPMPNVLTKFEVQQSGNFLRIIDADSSVYEGTIAPVPGQPQPATAEPGAQSLAFQTAGTNRTLQRLIRFTGNFEPAEIAVQPGPAQQGPVTDNMTLAARLGAETIAGAGQTGAPQPSEATVPTPARIQGNVIFDGNQLQIEAEQVSQSPAARPAQSQPPLQ